MKYSFILLIIPISFSCASEEVDGEVKEIITSAPVIKAHIFEKNNPTNETYTDSLGQFHIKALTVIVEKENYESKTVKFDHCESNYIMLKVKK
jgi:hypothetical protein